MLFVFREENDHDVMYEKGEFLNLGNIAQLTDMAPGLQVGYSLCESWS